MSIATVEALELSQILGSMLASIVDAQAHSARATVDFVEDIGFQKTATGDKLRTVKLRYTKKDENGVAAEFEVDVPLLALVNVPALAVKNATLTFSYDVVTASTPNPPPGGITAPVTAGLKARVAALTGFVRRPPATTKESERRTTAIDLSVTLEQQEMPVGIERLFDLAELGLIERPVIPPP